MSQSAAFKDRYQAMWGTVGFGRELALGGWLCALFRLTSGDIHVEGIGTLSPDRNVEQSSDPDFYVPKFNLHFEATGSYYTMAKSISRCAEKWHVAQPCLGVREGKVRDAAAKRILTRLYFASVNEVQGDIRFIHAPDCRRYDLVEGYEPGAPDRYYLIPWQKWLRAYELKAEVEGSP